MYCSIYSMFHLFVSVLLHYCTVQIGNHVFRVMLIKFVLLTNKTISYTKIHLFSYVFTLKLTVFNFLFSSYIFRIHKTQIPTKLTLNFSVEEFYVFTCILNVRSCAITTKFHQYKTATTLRLLPAPAALLFLCSALSVVF